jgi:hypothetical protein
MHFFDTTTWIPTSKKALKSTIYYIHFVSFVNIDRIPRFRLCSVNDYRAVPLTVMSPTNCAVLLVALDRPPCKSPPDCVPHERRSLHGGWPIDRVRKVSCGCVTEAPPMYSSRLCKARHACAKTLRLTDYCVRRSRIEQSEHLYYRGG